MCPSLPQFLAVKSIIIMVNQFFIEIFIIKFCTPDETRTRSLTLKVLRLNLFGLRSINLLSLF
jgi:hypothetical protein